MRVRFVDAAGAPRSSFRDRLCTLFDLFDLAGVLLKEIYVGPAAMALSRSMVPGGKRNSPWTEPAAVLADDAGAGRRECSVRCGAKRGETTGVRRDGTRDGEWARPRVRTSQFGEKRGLMSDQHSDCSLHSRTDLLSNGETKAVMAATLGGLSPRCPARGRSAQSFSCSEVGEAHERQPKPGFCRSRGSAYTANFRLECPPFGMAPQDGDFGAVSFGAADVVAVVREDEASGWGARSVVRC